MKDVEKIIRALEAFPGRTVILYDSVSAEKITFQDVIDYIMRLHSENERLNDMEFTKEHCDLYSENEFLKAGLQKQNAEIERLGKVETELQELNAKYYNKAKDLRRENKQLAERKEFWEGMHDKVVAQFENLEDRIEEYENTIEIKVFRISELQKQVDELKKTQVKHIHIDEQFKKECEYEIKQAVKDTAKEIYLWLEEKDKRGMTVPFNMVLRQLKERYGVEGVDNGK